MSRRDSTSRYLGKAIILRRLLVALTLAVILPACASAKNQGPTLGSERGARYLVERSSGKPFLITGDSPWGISKWVSPLPNPDNPQGQSDAEYLLENEVDRGVNTIVTWLVTGSNDPNWNGHSPFNNTTHITSVNGAYFDDFKKILEIAKSKGIIVGINPLWEDRTRGWGPMYQRATATQMYKYGAFVAGKYAPSAYPNVFWIIGGDEVRTEQASPDVEKDDALARGIRSVDPEALITTHIWFPKYSSEYFSPLSSYPWLGLNGIYAYYPDAPSGPRGAEYAYQTSRRAYEAASIPHFLLEGEYEDRVTPGRSSAVMRRQAYWSILSGSTGQIYGSTGWDYTDDSRWKSDVGSYPGFNQLRFVNSLFSERPWCELVPDFEQKYISGDVGTWGKANWVTEARTNDGKLLIAYLPPTSRGAKTIAIAANTLSANYSARWFDPTSGEYRAVGNGTFAANAGHSFTSPGTNVGSTNDWALVLEVAQPMPDPGQPLPFSDDFESGSSNWQPVSGSWSVVSDGTGRFEGTGVHAVSWTGETSWTDYSVQGTLELVSTTGRAEMALLARYRDSSHFYWFGFFGGAWQIWKNDGGTWTLLESVPGNVTAGTDHTVKATLRGSSLSLSVDGALVARALDSGWSSGAIGVSVDSGTTARFDNIAAARD